VKKFELHRVFSQHIGDRVDTTLNSIPDGVRFSAASRDHYLTRAAYHVVHQVIQPFLNYPMSQVSTSIEQQFSKLLYNFNFTDITEAIPVNGAFIPIEVQEMSQESGEHYHPVAITKANYEFNNRIYPLPIRRGQNVNKYINEAFGIASEPFLKVDRFYQSNPADQAMVEAHAGIIDNTDKSRVVDLYNPFTSTGRKFEANVPITINLTAVIYPPDLSYYLSNNIEWKIEEWMLDLVFKHAGLLAMVDSQDLDMPERAMYMQPPQQRRRQ